MTDAFEAAFDEVWKAGNGSSGAAGKQQQAASDGTGGAQWPEPIDVIGAPDLVGWPTLTAECFARAALPLRHGRGRAPERRPLSTRG